MLNQLFSTDNFRDIYDKENRKGINLDSLFCSFNKIKELTEKIKKKTKEKKENEKEKRKLIIEEIKKLKNEKNTLLKEKLNEISDNIAKNKNILNIVRGKNFKGKNTFQLENIPENFFISKQIQYNLKKVFKIQQSSKNDILAQLFAILNDELPKYIIRTDIQHFYESIPQNAVIQKIKNNELLSTTSKNFIKRILYKYRELTNNTMGLPRGIGISAYLAEIYLRQLDEQILKQKNLIYYARYVDDIIIVFAKTSSKKIEDIWSDVETAITDKSLNPNIEKTIKIDTTEQNPPSFYFLGYDISLQPSHITFSFPKEKMTKYEQKIQKAFEIYKQAINKRGSAKDLYDRILFLASNTKFLNNKNNVIIGIYYSNLFLNNLNGLDYLDVFLKSKINDIENTKLKKSLCNISFKDGFKKRLFRKYSTAQFIKITKIWRDL